MDRPVKVSPIIVWQNFQPNSNNDDKPRLVTTLFPKVTTFFEVALRFSEDITHHRARPDVCGRKPFYTFYDGELVINAVHVPGVYITGHDGDWADGISIFCRAAHNITYATIKNMIPPRLDDVFLEILKKYEFDRQALCNIAFALALGERDTDTLEAFSDMSFPLTLKHYID